MNLEDLRIRDLTVHDPEIKLHENLPTLPFNLVITGKSSCGKTNCIIHLAKFYEKYFKSRILVFTKSRNGSLYSLEKPPYNALIFNDLEDYIERLLEHQRIQKEQGNKLKHFLIIFDDFCCDSSMRRTGGGIYNQLFSMSRHFNISVIISSQQYTQTPASIRRLSWFNIIYKITNRAEKKLMIAEQCENVEMDETQFEEVYNACTNEKYSFMFIDTRNSRWLKRFGI